MAKLNHDDLRYHQQLCYNLSVLLKLFQLTTIISWRYRIWSRKCSSSRRRRRSEVWWCDSSDSILTLNKQRARCEARVNKLLSLICQQGYFQLGYIFKTHLWVIWNGLKIWYSISCTNTTFYDLELHPSHILEAALGTTPSWDSWLSWTKIWVSLADITTSNDHSNTYMILFEVNG